MIDSPIGELLDESLCILWLERHLHPSGLTCPRCRHPTLRLCRAQGHVPAYRGRACEGYDPLLTGTACANTRQRPATLVLQLRGLAKGEPTARLARELGLSRKQLHTLRQRLQAKLKATAPPQVMAGPAVEADELYQHAGEKQHPTSRSQCPATAPRQSAQGPWHLCERSALHHEYHRARHGRAACLGGRPRRHADVSHPHRRKPFGWSHAAGHRRMAARPGQSSRPYHGPPWCPRMGAGC
jgi:hypothetical protein